MVEPFFFGPRGALALYHPSADPSSRKLLIICPPLFDDYQRSYKALADLANACASHPQGTHVLRIDYSGTGEAQGELSDVSIHDWLEDIHLAIDEGIALTGAEEVMLLGVRFGATLAAQCRHPAVIQYLFWDPIDSGQEYLLWLQQVNSIIESNHRRMAKQVNRRPEDIPYVCFALNEQFDIDMKKLEIDSICSGQPDKVWVATTSRRVMESGRFTKCEFSGYEYDWPELHEGILAPKPVLESIAKKVLNR